MALERMQFCRYCILAFMAVGYGDTVFTLSNGKTIGLSNPPILHSP